MTEKFKSYRFKTISAFLLIIAGTLLSIEAWNDKVDGNFDMIVGITTFLIGCVICLQIYGETLFKEV